MNIKNYMLLAVLSFSLSMLSCDKKQNKNLHKQVLTSKAIEQQAADTLLQHIQGQVKRFIIDPKKKNNLLSKKGIKIAIPENAFVTTNGSAPVGNVCVIVSEYHNPADILVSGINMQYNAANGPTQMESAGMFTIEARNGEYPLQLAQGKKIDIEVPSKNKAADFNLYYFDTLQNAWTETQKILPITNIKKEPVVVSAPKKQKTTSEKIRIEWVSSPSIERLVDGKKISLVKPVCVYDDIYFTIPLVTNTYPELALYKESVWTGYVSQDKMKVAAAFQVDELVSAKILERELPLNKYLLSLEFRNIKITAYMKIASLPKQCEINEEIYAAYLNERPMDKTLIEKFENKEKVSTKTDEIYRVFSITRMGLWNCDRLFLLTKKSIVHPTFRNASTNEVYTPATIYLVDKNINSVWTYHHDIVLNPDSDNLILFVSDKGKLCYARLNKLSDSREEKKMHLSIDVSEMADKPNNTEDLYLLMRKKM